MQLSLPKIAGLIAGIALGYTAPVPNGMAQTSPPSVPSSSMKPSASTPSSGAGIVTAPSGTMVIAPSGSTVIAPSGSMVIEITPSQAGAQVDAPPIAPKRRRVERDARHCLTQNTDTAIIRCAEKYL